MVCHIQIVNSHKIYITVYANVSRNLFPLRAKMGNLIVTNHTDRDICYVTDCLNICEKSHIVITMSSNIELSS